MEAYQQRVHEEKAELDNRIEKLDAFVQGPNFLNLDQDARYLMRRQLEVMVVYSHLLQARISRW